tara:strand:- start:151 stop:567 length:417 start_codon:yes stop_codon:yes gene_type:complete
MARTNPGKANAGRRMRRACYVFLAIAVLFSGFGVGHAAMAMSADGTHQAHNAPAKVQTATPDHQKCHDQAPAQEQAPPPSQHDMGGCCVNACFAPALPRDVLNVTPPVFDIQTLYPSADQAPALTAPAGLFRPPRDRA